MIRDPLQPQKTPYELLGVEVEADEEAINRAFKRAMMLPGVDLRALREARTTLLSPVDRAILDLFGYAPAAFDEVAGAQSQLELGARMGTAEAWTQTLAERFPDISPAHRLGVLWHWWALYEGERLAALVAALHDHGAPAGDESNKGKLLQRLARVEGRNCVPGQLASCPDPACPWRADCAIPTPPLAVLWRRSIACWSALLASPAFWRAIQARDSRISNTVAGQVRENLENAWPQWLSNWRARFEEAGVGALADEYRELELDWAAELHAARLVAREGNSLLGPGADGVGCGRLLLAQLQQWKDVLARVEAARKASPGSERLRELSLGLSEHARVAQLVARQQWELALARIAGLRPGAQADLVVQELRGRALLGCGQQHASLGEMQEALGCWRQLLDAPASEELRTQGRTAVEEACLARAEALHSAGQVAAAIALLESGQPLASSRRLDLRLADWLCVQAVRTFNQVQQRAKARGGPPQAADEQELEDALEQLERAEKLGSSNARQQLPVAHQVLAAVKEASRGGAKVEQAIQSINRIQEEVRKRGYPTEEDERGLEAAAHTLELAASRGSQHASEQLLVARQVLAMTRKALHAPWSDLMRQANEAAGTQDWDTAVQCLRRALPLAANDTGAQVAIRKNLAASLTNRAVRTFNRYRGATPETRKALKDLEEAASLDPDSEHVHVNLKLARSVMSESSSTPSQRGDWGGLYWDEWSLAATVVAWLIFIIRGAGGWAAMFFCLAGMLLVESFQSFVRDADRARARQKRATVMAVLEIVSAVIFVALALLR